MAKSGKKDYSKATHSVVGKSSKEKKKAIYKMIEALIADKTEDAQVHLHEYLKIKTHEILTNESEDADGDEIEKDEKKEKEKSDKTDDEVDEDEDEDKEKEKDQEKEIEDDDDKETVSEGEWLQPRHPDGAMSRKVHGNIKFHTGKRDQLLKHKNYAPDLDEEDVEDIKWETNGKSRALRHGNNAPGLEDKPKGEMFKKGERRNTKQ